MYDLSWKQREKFEPRITDETVYTKISEQKIHCYYINNQSLEQGCDNIPS